MAEGKGKLLTYTLGVEDLLNTAEKVKEAIRSGKTPGDFSGTQEAVIYEADVEHFCRGCDYFKNVETPCERVGKNNQRRYAARRFCGWAKVKGKQTKKTG